MSDSIKHECGVVLLRLLKPLAYYKKKYDSSLYGIDKMYLLMEKQHNRGQDGAGFASVKLNMNPGERYISRIKSMHSTPIQDVFQRINGSIQTALKEFPETEKNNIDYTKKYLPYVGELSLGHVRYGTSGKNNLESVHPFLRQNNWMHRNLIIAGNFNMTNSNKMFKKLVQLGQHPKEKVDAVTVMEKIGHFLDDAVSKIYKQVKKEGFTKQEASSLIAERLNIAKILKKASKGWDGGYTMVGLLGHGDAFVMRDPSGIRPCYYYYDDEILVATSERPPIQTVFDLKISQIKELNPGCAIIVKSSGAININEVVKPLERKSCSFERIYFSRGNDAEIYKERKSLGKLIFPIIMEKVNYNMENTVFSYIPNTAEIAFLGMINAAQEYSNESKTRLILKKKDTLSEQEIKKILSVQPRIEKITIKDAKLRTFITEDTNRDDLVAHVYDVTYGVLKPTDNLVIIDDSIVRGTTLKKSILQMLSRLNPKHIIVVSSAPQIRYPDCYGIDMAKLQKLIAFEATLQLHEDQGTKKDVVECIYKNCKAQQGKKDKEVYNAVTELYKPFSVEQIANKIAEIVSKDLKVKISIVFQPIENLHKACPNHRGDWYFTGNYPTPGGNRVANNAFINFYEGVEKRAY